MPSAETVTVTSAMPIPPTLTRPAMPEVRNWMPSNGTVAVSPSATVTFCDVVSNE